MIAVGLLLLAPLTAGGLSLLIKSSRWLHVTNLISIGTFVGAEVVLARAVFSQGSVTAFADIVYIDALSSVILFIIGTVGLALEPEPFCFLETTDETVAYFTDHLYSGAAAARLAKLAGIPISEALTALRRHVGVVFDICHQAVEYENISESLQKLVNAGIPVFKLQEAAAIYVPKVTQQSVDVLKKYAETIYLTQTVEKKDGQFSKFLNLEDAFATWRPSSEAREWRTHIHVPVFLDDLGAFRTTRFAIEDALRFHKANPLSRQLEIETYTWDVLPDSLKTGDIVDYVCQEIEWVRGQLS